MIHILLSVIVPVGLIIAIGILTGRHLHIDRRSLPRISLYVLAPALFFDNIYRAQIALEHVFGIITGCILVYTALYLLVALAGRLARLPAPISRSLIGTTVFPNSGNVGLPLVFFAFGEPGVALATIYVITSGILITLLGPSLFGGVGLRSGLRLTLRLPSLYAALSAVAIRLLAIELPAPLIDGIHLLGQAAIPVLLLSLGITLSNAQLAWGRYELVSGLLRLALGPAIAWIVGTGIGLSGLELAILVLESGTPTALNAFIFSLEFGGDADRIARVVATSTLLALISIPIVLWSLGISPS